MKSSFQKILYGSYVLMLLGFFGLYYFAKQTIAEEEGKITALSSDHEVVTVLQDILISLQRAESNRRGYVITGEKEYIQNYNASVEAVQRSLIYLRRLNVHGMYQDEFLDSLSSDINDRIKFLKSSIELSIVDASSDSLQALLTSQGRDLMASIRTTVLEMLVEKANSRDEIFRAIGHVNAGLKSLYDYSLIALALFLCGISFTTYTYFRRSNIMEEALRRENYQARQQAQHATSRYQDLKIETSEKLNRQAEGSKEDT